MADKILVIEDDSGFREGLCLYLTSIGYNVVSAPDAFKGMELFISEDPDLILLDVMLPGKKGTDLCREIRLSSNVPIIMVTAMVDEEINSLKIGADDFITKPIDDHEFLNAHIESTLRRARWTREESNQEILTVGPLTIDIVGHEVRRNGEKLSLTPLEFNLLCTLAADPKKVFSREDLLEKVWGYRYKSDTRLVNVHIQRLRSKIEDDPEDPKLVVTERGVGYKAGAF